MNSLYGTREIQDRIPEGTQSEVYLAPGPEGHDNGSYAFTGTANSYIDLFNSDGGVLDLRYSLTLLCWVYYDGQIGPVVIYFSDSAWGISIYVYNGKYTFPIWRRDGRFLSRAESITPIVSAWKFVVVSYNHVSGEGKVWIDGVLERTVNVGAGTELGTQYKVRMGGNGRATFFKGRIAKMGVYNVVLTQEQIQEIKGKNVRQICEHTQKN